MSGGNNRSIELEKNIHYVLENIGLLKRLENFLFLEKEVKADADSN